MTSLKKIELHLHLDGSISLDLASKLSGLSLGELKAKMIEFITKGRTFYKRIFDSFPDLTKTK